MQIYGYVEIKVATDWLAVIKVSSLLLDHSDLNGCLFGVDNHARYRPIFADRGIPADVSHTVAEELGGSAVETSARRVTWARFDELKRVDWNEPALGRDERVSEFDADDVSRRVTKWLHHPTLEWIREELMRNPDMSITVNNRTFRRVILTRRDSLFDTDFPLVMELMASLAKRFGDDAVRLVVWFEP